MKFKDFINKYYDISDWKQKVIFIKDINKAFKHQKEFPINKKYCDNLEEYNYFVNSEYYEEIEME